MDQIIDELLQSLSETINKPSTKALFQGKDYHEIPFNQSNFNPITPIKGKLAFVDGGNAEILSAVNFSLQFFRIYYCIYENNKLLKQDKKEFFALINSIPKNNKIFFQTKLFQSDLEIPLIQSTEVESLASVADLIRRAAEIEITKEINSEYVILDGNLKADAEFIRELLKNKTLYALSKTNELYTDSGNSLTVELSTLSPFDSWQYTNLVKISSKMHNADIVITKLHPLSKYIFKLETPKDTDLNIIPVLASNSTDPVFLGYPYGLVQADKHARVSNQEKEYFKVKLLTSSKNKEKLSQYLNTINAHNILDSIL
ncbi:hypothetical protein HN592_01665 [Candidatus Woesearchaeota archaeon]|mgnify:CR=1 FL=1|jgi:hypothetical protein|nr:hypothetical protein [Candidatus Woesearchaeota archaeon]MBT4368610.1 hypothetical protein [Candidatus Woesearchaeota archaeon]MBT4713081.1 hypothetical protein [Candidatus Woesearchaeota archaeon]MBT6639003.1 hypothetical protein [Candidatus Woesearchaeota archaeon]MBT7134202.1 hypothetical protein [Candidatus Woesearchaeota archaeon]